MNPFRLVSYKKGLKTYYEIMKRYHECHIFSFILSVIMFFICLKIVFLPSLFVFRYL